MVIAGEFWTGASALGLANGFRRLGWAVQDIDVDRYFACLGRNYLGRAVRRVVSPLAATEFRRAVVAACAALKPDLFLTVKGRLVSADMIDQIKRDGAQAVLYYPDVDFDHPGVSPETFALYDKVITTKTFHLPYLRNRFGAARVSHVAHGYSAGVHQPLWSTVGEDLFTVDLLHAGICSAYKIKWLTDVKIRQSKATLRIIGDGWNGPTRGTELADSIAGHALFGAAYAQALQSARINIAIHYGPAACGWQDAVSTRTFEIPACRGFMLHVDSDEVRELYAVGDEIDVFSTPSELADKISYDLARPHVRGAMIERAYRRCVPAYSYDTRAVEIASLLKTM
jgi:hypothetical protein